MSKRYDMDIELFLRWKFQKEKVENAAWLEQRRVEGHIDPTRWVSVASGVCEVLEAETKHLVECDQCRRTIEKIREGMFATENALHSHRESAQFPVVPVQTSASAKSESLQVDLIFANPDSYVRTLKVAAGSDTVASANARLLLIEASLRLMRKRLSEGGLFETLTRDPNSPAKEAAKTSTTISASKPDTDTLSGELPVEPIDTQLLCNLAKNVKNRLAEKLIPVDINGTKSVSWSQLLSSFLDESAESNESVFVREFMIEFKRFLDLFNGNTQLILISKLHAIGIRSNELRNSKLASCVGVSEPETRIAWQNSLMLSVR